MYAECGTECIPTKGPWSLYSILVNMELPQAVFYLSLNYPEGIGSKACHTPLDKRGKKTLESDFSNWGLGPGLEAKIVNPSGLPLRDRKSNEQNDLTCFLASPIPTLFSETVEEALP